MKKIAILLLFLGIAWASDLETISPIPKGTWDYRQGTIYVSTPTEGGMAVNKNYVSTISSATNEDIEVIKSSITIIQNDISDLGYSTGTLKSELDAEITDTDTNFANVATATNTLQSNIGTEESARIFTDQSIGVSTGNIQSQLDTLETAVATDTTTLRTDLTATALSTGTNKTLIDANANGISELGYSTGTIYSALQHWVGVDGSYRRRNDTFHAVRNRNILIAGERA